MRQFGCVGGGIFIDQKCRCVAAKPRFLSQHIALFLVLNTTTQGIQMNSELLSSLRQQNRLLKQFLGLSSVGLIVLLLVAAKPQDDRMRFSEIDVQRINIVNSNGKLEMVLSNRTRLPKSVTNGQENSEDRDKPGLIFYNQLGDEAGGLIFDGKLDTNGTPRSGMHFSMDRFGGDQQLALGHYESGGVMESGLNVYDRGLAKDYQPLFKAYQDAPAGTEKEALKQKWLEAGGAQTQRLFVGKTRGRSAAVILADSKGKPRIMMLVTPDGQPMLNFMDDKGGVIQSLPNLNK
jgi:hypothetical protein